MMAPPNMLAVALNYAARGWNIFPLKPQAKNPAFLGGFYTATTNPETSSAGSVEATPTT